MDNDFTQKIYEVVELFESGDYEYGLTKLKRLSEQASNDEEKAIIARFFLDLGLLEDTKKMLNEVSGDSIESKRINAGVLHKEGDSDAALEIMYGIIQDQPVHDDYFVISQLFFEDNLPEVALRYINMAIEQADHIGYYYYYKGIYSYEIGEIEETLDAFNKAIELDGDEVVYHLALGEVLFNNGDFEEALKELDGVLNIYPDQDEALYLKGYLLIHMENFEEGIKCLEKSLEQQPESINILLALAEAHGKNNDITMANMFLNKIIEFDEFNIPAMKSLAANYFHNSEIDEAIELLDRALQLDPDDNSLHAMYKEFNIYN